MVVVACGFALLGVCWLGCFVVWRRVEVRSNFTNREWKARLAARASSMLARKRLENNVGDVGGAVLHSVPALGNKEQGMTG